MEATGLNTHSSVVVDKIACKTGLGDARETLMGLINQDVALKPQPVRGEEGGDLVPLALRNPMKNAKPPRWWDDAVDFYQPFHSEKWGTPRFPVIVTSSNFGIDALYGLGLSRDASYSPWATSDRCTDELAKTFGWKQNVTLISHACVSAQLGIMQATQMLENNLAESVLLFSFDYVGPFVAAGFHSLKILNTGMPAPYSNQSTGSIGLGDGIAAAVLTKGTHGWQIGPQSTYNEMYHFTSNNPDSSGFQQLLKTFSQKLPGRRFWIKGHGTGTLEAGKMEAITTQKLFPEAPLVSWKGSLGHTLGSCALVELAIAIDAMEYGRIPGTVGCTHPVFANNVALESFDAQNLEGCLLLSNAFGGAHAAMWIEHA